MKLGLEFKQEKKRILFVNMYDVNAEILSDFYISWGYNVERIGLSDTANFLRKDNSFYIALFQFNEFTVAEYEALRMLKNKTYPAKLVITAPYLSSTHVTRLKLFGVNNFLIQPYTPDDIRKTIKEEQSIVQ